MWVFFCFCCCCFFVCLFLSTISNVLTFNCVCSGGNAPRQERYRLENTIRKARGVIGRQQETFDSVHHRRLTDRLKMIQADRTHPLRPEFDSRLIDRSGRLRVRIRKQHASISSYSEKNTRTQSDYLTNRPQLVKSGSALSSIVLPCSQCKTCRTVTATRIAPVSAQLFQTPS